MNDNFHAENAILGTLLGNNDALESLPNLKTQHFALGANRTIFAAIYSLITTNKLADVITVADYLDNKDLLESVGGRIALHNLTNSESSVKNIGRYLEIMIDKAHKRELKEACRQAIEAADGATPSTQLIDRTAAQLEAIQAQRSVGEPEEISSALSAYIELMDRRTEKTERFTKTGLDDIDAKLGGGFSDGDLIIVAGRPSMGKTAFCTTIANYVAENETVLFFSLEMTKQQLMDRSVASYGSIPLGWLRTPGQDDHDLWSRFSMGVEKVRNLKMFVDDTPAQSLIDIRAKARRIKRKYGLGLVVVDYIGLMAGSGKSDNRTQEVGEFSRGLKALAKELNCPVMALAQLSRKCEERSDKRPLMSDLRDSGEIEQDADVIMFIYRDEVYHPETMDKGVAEIIIAKQRQGETGTVACAYQGQYTRFDNLAYRWERKQPEKPKKLGFTL
jgi:replicative DNA helicase